MRKHIELQFRGGLDHEMLNGNIGNFDMILAAAVELPKNRPEHYQTVKETL